MINIAKTPMRIVRINPLNNTLIGDAIKSNNVRFGIEKSILFSGISENVKHEDKSSLYDFVNRDKLGVIITEKETPEKHIKNSDIFDTTVQMVIVQPNLAKLHDLIESKQFKEYIEHALVIVYGDDETYHHDVCQTMGTAIVDTKSSITYGWA